MGLFRLDRALTLGIARPLIRLRGRGQQKRIPILMYHGIEAGTGPRGPYFELNTAPQVFVNHMGLLRDSGYRTLSMHEALAALREGCEVNKRVVITFDDGYRSFHDRALPILTGMGFAATVFLISDLTHAQRVRRNQHDYMTWSEVREARRHGIEFGSHTATHPELERISLGQIDDELVRSKRTIEDELGEPVRSFSFPHAFPLHNKGFIEGLRRRLEACGYQNGVTTVIGRAGREHNPLFLPRLPINSHDDLRLFEAKLEGAYDWLHGAQSVYKHVLAQRSAPPQDGREHPGLRAV